MLDVVILVNLFSNILLTLIVNHIYYTVAMIYLRKISDLSSISHAFNSAMCEIYKVKYESLACIYRFTGQSDIVHDIQDRRNRFITSLYNSHNEVVSHFAV